MSSAELASSAAPRRSRRMAWQTIDGETVLLDVDGRELMGVNETAARVWALCDGNHTIAQIADAIASEFGAGPDEALADVRGFVAELLSRGALEV